VDDGATGDRDYEQDMDEAAGDVKGEEAKEFVKEKAGQLKESTQKSAENAKE